MMSKRYAESYDFRLKRLSIYLVMIIMRIGLHFMIEVRHRSITFGVGSIGWSRKGTKQLFGASILCNPILDGATKVKVDGNGTCGNGTCGDGFMSVCPAN